MYGFPFDSQINGTDEAGIPIYDRASNSEELARILHSFFSDGIFGTGGFAATADGSLTLTLSGGSVLIQGRYGYSPDPISVVLPAAGNQARTDTVVLRLDLSVDKRSIDAYAITGSGNAVPALTRNGTVWELGICNVLRPANSTGIVQSNVTDTRLDTARCGYVVANMQQFDTDDLYLQIQSDLESFRVNEKAAFDQFFDDIQTTLSGDVAGNLAGLIALRPVIHSYSVYVPANGWVETGDYYTQEVAVEGVISDSDACDVTVAYDPEYKEAFLACELDAIEQGDGSITLRVVSIPEEGFLINVQVATTGQLGSGDPADIPSVVNDSAASTTTTYSSAKLEADFLKNETGSVSRDNIADGSINNAKLNFESVSNAKIMPGTIQKDRLHADAIAYLTGSQYMRISYDGSSRMDVYQGNHMYALRLKTDAAIHLYTWLINHAYYNGEFLFNGMDIEAPMKMMGRSDFIGGIHGDEQMETFRMIADGVDITETAVELSDVKTLSVYVTSTVYDVDSMDAIFSRTKVLTFGGNKLKVENRWVYIGNAPDFVERWPGCGLYSVFLDKTLGYTTNESLMPSLTAYGYNKNIDRVTYWVSGTMITMRALDGKENEHYMGGVEMLSGTRLKAYFDTIHSYDGVEINNGDVLAASFEITVGEVV